MKWPFRQFHLFSILDAYNASSLPLDLLICKHFRKHRALGSKDRKFIAENAYGMIRWLGLLDYFCTSSTTWEKRYEIYKELSPLEYIDKRDIPLHIRLSFPEILFNLIRDAYGEEDAKKLCLASNTAAPTTVRVNTLKSSRSRLLNSWKNKYDVSACKHSETGITFHKKINLFSLPEFKKGFFEVQDEGSQLVAYSIKAKPGDQIMDYCSGSGGKSLAFAPLMEKSGQIYLHDIRPHILLECRKRLRRAGIENGQIIAPNSSRLKRFKKSMNWVLVDAPCSGSGTMRRNPDMKWKFSLNSLKQLIGEQRSIFEKALSYVRPGGKIVYATCSLLKEENENQVEHFLKTYDIELDEKPFKTLLKKNSMDGFFAASFTKKTDRKSNNDIFRLKDRMSI